MIVQINENNKELYRALFADAAAEILSIKGETVSISTLNEYFHYLPIIVAANKSNLGKFLMIPLEEEAVEVDANNRSLKVPSVYAKCAALEGDHIAETISFTIDRYYDYMDLATTEIYVQWKTKTTEGAEKIELIDLSSTGKIKFGWPLTSEITAVPGPVEFSVRFFRRGEGENLAYSFNTIANTITVKPALRADINNEADVEAPVADRMFMNAIIASQLSQEGMPIALTPSFDAAQSGTDLPAKAALVSNVLTLKAQANTGDTGAISYQWEYAANNEDFTPVEGKQWDMQVVQPTERNKWDTYYEKTGEGEGAAAYTVYAGGFTTEEVEGKTFYERYTSYNLPASGVITGTYRVAAVNKLGQNESLPKYSTYCVVPGPADVVLSKDLNELELYKEGLTLSVDAVAIDSPINYSWTKSTTSAESLVDAGVAAKSLAITSPGWYQAKADTTLNRETKEAFSKICKVVADTQIPVATISSDAAEDGDINIGFAEEAILKVTASIPVMEDVAEELWKGELSYVWEVMAPDTTEYIVLTDDYPAIGRSLVVSGLGTDTLKVRNIEDGAAYGLRCKVIHTFGGVSKETITETITIY